MLFITKYNFASEAMIFLSKIYTYPVDNEYISIDVSGNFNGKDKYWLNISQELIKRFPKLSGLCGPHTCEIILDRYVEAIKIIKDNGCAVSFSDDILVFK